MIIGISGPFNPLSAKDYFDNSVQLPNINLTASSVNTYVLSLLEMGFKVVIFTIDITEKKNKKYIGKNITVYTTYNSFNLPFARRLRVHKRIKNQIKEAINEIDVLHAEWTYEYAFASLSFIEEKKVFCSVRDWCPYLLSLADSIKDKLYWGISYYMFKNVMKEKRIVFIANSEYTYNQILNYYPDNKTVIIPNPIKRSYILEERDKYPAESVFVSISHSLEDPRKNYHILLKSFREYLKEDKNSILVLIGLYSNEWLKKMHNENLLHNVQLMGPLNHEEIFNVLDNSSCLIHPSLEETFGNIFLEAMCRRIPCIGGEKSGAVPQVLGYGKFGILCDVTDISSLTNAMSKIKNRELISEIIESSTIYIKETYADNIIRDAHIRLYEKYLNN